MTGTDWAALRHTYFDRLAPADVHAGAHMIERLVVGGASIDTVIREVLRPAQIEVGRRWQTNEWTVADEHAASAVTEAALMAAAVSAPQSAGTSNGLVVLACADGEWHTLPLRMVTEVLVAAGFQCVFLGASVPSLHLRDYLEKARPLALALNCSTALSLDGAGESIEAAHAAGVPVLVGGRGFGPDAHRASRLGADAWTDEPQAAAEILASWAAEPPVLATSGGPNAEPVPGPAELLRIRDHVVRALCAQFPALDAYTERQWARTNEDIDFIVRFGVTAVRYDDERIVSDFAAWLREVLTARHVPAVVFHSSVLAVADALSDARPRTSEWVRAAADGRVALAAFRTL